MTSDVIFDSCVVAKLVLPEPDSLLAIQRANAAKDSGGKVLVLDLADIEVANAIWKQYIRKLVDAAAAKVMLTKLRLLDVRRFVARKHLRRGLEIAIQYQVAVYDALFVAAVESVGCEARTSDAKLVQKIQSDFPQIQLLK